MNRRSFQWEELRVCLDRHHEMDFPLLRSTLAPGVCDIPAQAAAEPPPPTRCGNAGRSVNSVFAGCHEAASSNAPRTCRAVRVQENNFARSNPRACKSCRNEPEVNTKRSVSLNPAKSELVGYAAASPPTSASDELRKRIVGHPQAMASRGGKPKPS